MAKKKEEITIRSSATEYLTFIASTGDNENTFEVRYQDENIWLTQKMMAILYDVSVSAINQHLKNIFEDMELDDERLKRGTLLTDKYFEEQLERIREIRASERKFYQKITDIYATAIDYDKDAKSTRRFYATVQNKMHYAVHGHTAAELIVERADSTKEHIEG